MKMELPIIEEHALKIVWSNICRGALGILLMEIQIKIVGTIIISVIITMLILFPFIKNALRLKKSLAVLSSKRINGWYKQYIKVQ